MKEYTINNINEFFEDLMNNPNAKINMLHVYGVYERECEENKRKQEIENRYKTSRGRAVAHIINDDIAIVEYSEFNMLMGYFADVNKNTNNYIWPTFEMALLCAVSIKLTGCEDATEWMWKLVGGD